MKPVLKPRGSNRLYLQCDELVSDFAFKFNLRRYTMADKLRRYTDMRRDKLRRYTEAEQAR
jgi:hypothetical protein